MVFSNNLLAGSGGQSTGYEIDQSIRFNKSASALMSRTFGTATDRNVFTYAFWMKACSESNGYTLETNTTGGVTFSGMVMNGGSMQFFDYTGGSANIDVRTAFINETKFRDYSAWYHAMFVYDSDESTAADRLKFFINGEQYPSDDLVGPSGGSPVFPGSGANSYFNSSIVHRISSSVNGLVDGYMADIYFIDGQALDPTSFGEFSSTTGQFIPIEYSGTFGNNGFYIDGRDSSDLGDDESGNGNDFSTSNMGTDDQVTDSPTNNTATWNSRSGTVNPATLSDGNLTALRSGNGSGIERSTISFPATENFYAEFTIDATGSGSHVWEVGVIADDDPGLYQTSESRVGNEENGYSYRTNWSGSPAPSKVNNGTATSYGTAGSATHVIGVQLNDGSLTFYHNNSSQGVAFTGLSGNFLFAFSSQGGGKVTANFGQTGFTYTPPTGAKALTAPNLPNPAIADPTDHFDSKLWTGNDTDGRAITGYNFQPDWVWIKSRSGAYSHSITDAVRGAGPYIQSNTSDAEASGPGAFGSTLAFTSDGYTLDNGTSDNLYVNAGSETYVGWAWKANGSGSSNENGSISATVSANTTAGFSVGIYTGNGTDNATVGHGLGGADMVWVKRRNTTGNWRVYHKHTNKLLYLDLTNAGVSPTEIKSTSSTTFTLGSGNGFNGSGDTHVFYAFQSIDGFSKISSYVGNGSTNGSYVYTGFRPAWVLIKRTNAVQEWQIYDDKRSPFNPVTDRLQANSNSAEDDLSPNDNELDFLSNGFKLIEDNGGMNASGSTYLYMAFAETPFKTATAR